MDQFDKVIGYEREKEELRRLCDVLKNREKYLRLGVKIPKAILLYGAPGLGKTLMAKAVIAETGRAVFHCKKNKSNGEFVNDIKQTFESAIREAPSIIFFDDMDKFAEDNLQQNCNKEEFVAIQTGLEDIVDQDVFVIATANDIDYLPESLLRDGRFGKQIEFSAPSFSDAVKIVAHFLSSKNLSEEVNATSLAHILSGNSCAMLEEVVNEAGIYAAYANRDKITCEDIKRAVSRILLNRYEPQEIDAATRSRVAYHEAGHAVLRLLSDESVGCLAIGKCGKDGLGIGMCCSPSRRLYETARDIEHDIMYLLAGRASIELQFGEIDVGAVKDLRSAMTEIEHYVERNGGAGLEYLYCRSEYASAPPYRLDTIHERKMHLLEELYQRAKLLLSQNKQLLDQLAQALYEKGILFYDEIMDIVGGVRP